MAKSKSDAKSESFGEIIKTIVYALLIALAFRVLLFQPFSIPSSSMKSTLLIGDYLFVSKYSYGYSKHSVPFSLIPFEGRIFANEPERGDVIVFKNTRDGNRDYIKRLIGLPGDVIQLNEGKLSINGEQMDVELVEPFGEPRAFSQKCVSEDVEDNTRICLKDQFLETLPNGVSYNILNADRNLSTNDNTREFVVPAGHYFFLGDNRDNSGDSRVGNVGMVPFENLIGRAEIIFLSSKSSPFAIWDWRWDRFVKFIN